MIIRSERKTKFTVINNNLINDDTLEWKDVGMLVYLLSKPDSWEISATHLAKVRRTGLNGVYSILKNLRASGYVKMQRQKTGETRWTIYDMPINKPYHENPDKALPNEEKPSEANPSEVKANEEKPREDNHILINTEDNQILKKSSNQESDDDFLKRIFSSEEILIVKNMMSDLPLVLQKQAARVFSEKLKETTVKNKTAYFRKVLDSARNGTLALPTPAQAEKPKVKEPWERAGFESEKDYDLHMFNETLIKYGKKERENA